MTQLGNTLSVKESPVSVTDETRTGSVSAGVNFNQQGDEHADSKLKPSWSETKMEEVFDTNW